MIVEQITPLILTLNEAPNLRRCLERLRWAVEVVVLDSGSTDATAEIAREFSNVRFITRPFDDHTRQWNFGLAEAKTNWVLSLDADYVLGDAFENELAMMPDEPLCDAFFARFRYLIDGKALRATLYPPRAVLFRRDRCQYRSDGHTQLLYIQGASGMLRTRIDHDDRKPLSRWFLAQDNYAKLEVVKLLSLPDAELHFNDLIRRTIILAPILVACYTLFIRGLVFDGWRGWYYVLQRAVAEIMLSLRLLEQKLEKQSPRNGTNS